MREPFQQIKNENGAQERYDMERVFPYPCKFLFHDNKCFLSVIRKICDVRRSILRKNAVSSSSGSRFILEGAHGTVKRRNGEFYPGSDESV